MEFRILGPLEISSGDHTIGLAAAKERALLALLLIDAKRIVSADRLIDELWAGRPPETATTSLRVLVSRLRKSLAELDPSDVILTQPPGYLITVEAGELDSTKFEAAAARGRARLKAGDSGGGASVLREALDLWRGPALVDAGDLEPLRLEATRLEEARLGVLEDRVEADLAAGQHPHLVAELEQLTAAHPVRERLWSQRMRALYRSGRQADALDVFQSLRAVLDEQFGLVPSREIMALESAIIRQDPELTATRPSMTPTAAGSSLPTGVITLLLTDIEGSTPLWEAKPVAMEQTLNRHDELIGSVVASHGGHLLRARGEGDSTFSVFARATDAAEAALEMQAALASEPWPAGIDLRVRIALNTGETIERDGDYVGTTVNRAARLRGATAPGQIVVSRSTADVIVDHIEGASLVELGEKALRGLNRPERIFELLSATAVPSAPSGPVEVPLPQQLIRTTTGVFVGRDDELKQLAMIWEGTLLGERKLVLLAGEAGIGKTRLAAEFARTVHDAGAVVLFGRCDEEGSEPYQPFAEALRALIAVDPRVASRTRDLAALLPDSSSPAGESASSSATDAAADRRALFESVATTISATSSATPVLVVIDDLHWAARPTLLMLRHILRTEEEVPVVVLATYRDTDVDRSHPLADMLADLRREVDLTRLPVHGLDVSGILAYVEATAGQELADEDRHLADLVHRHTEGNPFFVVEVLRHFLEAGAIYPADGRWQTDLAKIDAIGLPEGVRDVIGRRLGRLSDVANRILAIGSVIGPEFSLEIVEMVVAGADREAALDALEHAVRVGLVSESAPGRYAFAHALIRQTLYDELTSTRRARLHRTIGEAIEGSAGADGQVEVLAHHFAEAALDGQVAKAADYALSAGRRALEQLASEEAVTHLERGLDLLELDVETDHARRAVLLEHLAIAKWSRLDREGARAATESAAAEARKSGDILCLARIVVLRTALTLIAEEDPLLQTLFEEVLAGVDPRHLAVRARVLAAYARYHSVSLGKGNEAVGIAADAVNLARSSGDSAVLASTLNAHLTVLRGVEGPAAQVQLADELIALATELGDLRLIGEGLMARALSNFDRGDMANHSRDIEELESLGRRHRWRFAAAFVLAQRAALAILAGRFREAEALEQQLLNESRGELESWLLVMGLAAVRALHEGNIELLKISVDAARQMPGLAMNYDTTMSAWLAAITDDTAAAKVSVEALFDTSGNLPLPYGPLRGVVAAIITDAVVRSGAKPPIENLLSELNEHSGCLLPVLRGAGVFNPTDHFIGLLYAHLHRWTEAEEKFQTALELAERVDSPVFTAHTHYWYARMLIDRGDPADRDRARSMTQSALTIAEDIGMGIVQSDATKQLELLETLGRSVQ